MKKIKKSGIILITTLIFLTLTFMLAVTLCKNGKQSILVGNRYAENEKAYLAAISGIEYIKGQLYADKNWEVNEPEKISSENGILIVKDPATSNLIGYMSTSGKVSNTNYDSKFEIFSKNNISKREFRSINNLNQSTPILSALEQYNSPNEGKNANGSKRKVPPKTFYAYVKGTSGKTVKYAEAMFVSNGPTALDGGNIINGKVTINSKSGGNYTTVDPFITLKNINNKKDGKITASNVLKFEANNNSNMDLNQVLNSKYSVSIASNGAYIGKFKRTPVIANGIRPKEIEPPIENLTYKQNNTSNKEVQKITTEQSKNTNTLSKGTYAFVNDTKDPDKSYWIYKEEENINNLKDIPNQTNINNLPKNIKLADRQVDITGDVNCSEGDVNFIVIDKTTKRNGAKKYTISNKNTVDFSISENGKIETTGNLVIRGEVTGSGKIYCGNSLTMNAGSILETRAQSGLAIYAENDINILKTKNLTNSSKEAESTIISQALQNVPENITLISSDDEEDNEEDEDGNLIPAIVLDEEIDMATYNQWLEQNNINQTTIVINGTKYDVSSIMANRIPQEGQNLTFYTETGQEKYKMSISDDKMTIYEHDDCSGEYKLVGSVNKNSIFNRTTGDVDIENYQPQDHGGTSDHYWSDYALYVKGNYLGIVDFSSQYRTSYNPNNTYGSDNFFFSTNPHEGAGNIQSRFTVNSSSSSTSDTDTGATITKELTVQEYVDNYYKEHIGDTMIKGSIYSKNGNITIDAQKKSFNVTGALITANAENKQNNDGGNLIIKNASYVNLLYDPDYVPFFENQGILTTTIFESVF